MPITTESKAIKAVKQQRPNRSKQMDIQVEPGDNTKYLQHSMEIYNLPKIDSYNLKEVEDRTEEYFSICLKNDMKPSVAGYALALGMDRTNLFLILNGKTKRAPSILDSIKRAISFINAGMEDYMQNGKINPASGIFLMKNNMGYRDETEVVLSPGAEKKSIEELTEEASLLPDPDEN